MLVNASVSYRVLSSRNCLELGNKGSPLHWMLLKLMEVQVIYIEAVIPCSSMLCFHAVEQDSEHGFFFVFFLCELVSLLFGTAGMLTDFKCL
jgi:hypothetical protein